MLTFGLSSRHPGFSHNIDVATPEIIYRQIPHSPRFGNPSSLPYSSAGPFTWLSRDASANPRLPDSRLTGRQHDSSEIRRPSRDRSGINKLHAEPTCGACQGTNDEHHGHSDSDSYPPSYADRGHPYDIALPVLRSRLPKYCFVCIHIWYIHTHSGFVLSELRVDNSGLLFLVRRGLWAGGNRWEGHTYYHHHGGSGADVPAPGRNVSTAATQGGGEYDAKYSHEGGRSGNDHIRDPGCIAESSEERIVSSIKVDRCGRFSVLF